MAVRPGIVIVRGDIWSAIEKGPLTSKPRPVLVIQNDVANALHSTITVCLMSASLSSSSLFRLAIVPSPGNRLVEPSEIQADRIFSFRRENLDYRIGAASPADMARVEAALRRWLDL